MTSELVRTRADETFTAERPWGQFRQFVQNEPVSVKVITVNAGHRLSLQRHRNRDELWQVLDRPLLVQVDGRTWTAGVGELVWVPASVEHRLTNPGDRPARVLEIAFGEFDEADIVRIEDDYSR